VFHDGKITDGATIERTRGSSRGREVKFGGSREKTSLRALSDLFRVILLADRGADNGARDRCREIDNAQDKPEAD